MNFQIFIISKIQNSSFIALIILRHVLFKPIARSLKTDSVAVSKSTEHDVTLTPFVADLSYPGLSNFYRICEVDGREGAENLALICACV